MKTNSPSWMANKARKQIKANSKATKWEATTEAVLFIPYTYISVSLATKHNPTNLSARVNGC